MAEEPVLANRWAQIPADTEILLTHGPALGQLDRTEDGLAVGSSSLRQRLDELAALRLHLVGHIHEEQGALDWYGRRLTVNASALDERYAPRHELIVAHWQPDGAPPQLERVPLRLHDRSRG